MKKTIFILRLGVPELVKADALLLKPILDDNDIILGTALPFGIINMVTTSLSVEDLIKLTAQVESESDDNLPVVIWERGKGAGMNLDNFENIAEMIQEFDEKTAPKKVYIRMSIDDVLDKISKSGMDSLSETELSLLKSYK